MVIAAHTLHHKVDKLPFSAIARFFNETKGIVQQHWASRPMGFGT
jgi:hypothetical protein